jgi:hypothetical protein
MFFQSMLGAAAVIMRDEPWVVKLVLPFLLSLAAIYTLNHMHTVSEAIGWKCRLLHYLYEFKLILD